MKNDATLKIRVPAEELARWTADAKTAGVSLSEWVRNACVLHVPISLGDLRKVVKAQAEAVPIPTKSRATTKPTYCTHGIMVGGRCERCGGIAST